LQLSRFGYFDREILSGWATVFAVAELRPYSPKYSKRMAAHLKSSHSGLRLFPESGRPIHNLVDAAMAVTEAI
jgi:hypothetical protein